MGDVFDEVMDVLNDVDGLSPDWKLDNDHERIVSSPHTHSANVFHYRSTQLQKIHSGQGWQETNYFDRQVTDERNLRDGDVWTLNGSTLPPAPPQTSEFYPDISALSVPVDDYFPQTYASYQGVRQGFIPPIEYKSTELSPARIGYNMCTLKHPSRPISQFPLSPTPTEYNLKNPCQSLTRKANTARGGSNCHRPPQDQSTKYNQQVVTTTLGNIGLDYAPPIIQGIPLVSVNTMPDRFRGIFPFQLFNAVQSRCFGSVYRTNYNIVLSSPTGSGKTAVMELAICALAGELTQGNYKAIYLAPTKALCSERKRDWEKKFATLGLVCTELTGDTQHAQLKNIKNGDIIITTPEKWDSMTRRWDDHKKLLELVRLFLIDEVHILKEARGATLEVIVSRMRSIGSNVRFVALSATVPNSADIATWLGKDTENPNLPAYDERFGEEFRPVKLQKFVYGYPYTGNDFIFDRSLDKMLPGLIQKHSSGKPIMIFCMTRAMCVNTAKMLAERWRALQQRERYWPAPTVKFSFKDRELQSIGTCGVAFHHAGLDASDRVLVERLFLEGGLHVICCTSTLAVGVNLPTHLVIIKNTMTWFDGQTKDYIDLEVMQMLGRAGRPQFDDSAVAVIMTKKENKERYEKMVSGTETLESCLHENLVEHMNAEIGLGTITSTESAKEWLRSTFFYVRLKRNPIYYKLDKYGESNSVDQNLREICEKNINLLEKFGLALSNRSILKCSELGNAMARYYIRFATMQTILELKEKAKLPEILLTLSKAHEFKDIRFRSGEKRLYKELNKFVKYPLKTELIHAFHKAYILIQFEVGMMEFPTEANLQNYKTTLIQDKNFVFQHCHRIIRCIIDCKLYFKDSISVKTSLEVARCLKGKVWENSPLQLRQMEGFGPVSVKKLVSAGVRSLEMLGQLEPHEIESIMSRNPPFGSKVAKAVREIPKLRLVSHQISKVGNCKDPVKMEVRTEIGYLNDNIPGKFRGIMLFANFLAERSDGLLVDFRRIPIFKLEGGKDIRFTVDLISPEQTLICHLVCEDIVGTLKTHELKPNVERTLYPPPVPHPTPDLQVGVAQSLGVRASSTISPIITSGDNMEGSKLPLSGGKGGKYGSELLTAGTGGDSCFLRIDDFDISDLHKGVTKGAENMDEDTTRSITSTNHTRLFSGGGEDKAPEQLSNGNFMCRHRCGDKRRCKHFCCREGLERPSRPLKRRASMIKAVQPDVLTRGRGPSPMQQSPTEPILLGEMEGLRASALATYIENIHTETVDLLMGEGDVYERKGLVTSSSERLETLSSKDTGSDYRPPGKSPIYPYTSRELSETPLVISDRLLPSDRQQPSPPITALRYLEEDTLLFDSPNGYDEGRVDPPMLRTVTGEQVAGCNQGSSNFGLAGGLSLEPPTMLLGVSLGHVESKDETPVFQTLGQNFKLSSDGTRCEEMRLTRDFPAPVFHHSYSQVTQPQDGHEKNVPFFRNMTQGSSGVVGSTTPKMSSLDKIRKDPFNSHTKGQQKRNSMNSDTKKTNDAMPLNLSDRFVKYNALVKHIGERKSYQMTSTPAVPDRETPANILDFLGTCVIYSAESSMEKPYVAGG